MSLTRTQLVTAVADRAEAKQVLGVLEKIVLEELGKAQKIRIGGVALRTVRVKTAQKARKGRNPATGAEITIAAEPAIVDLRARPLANAKAALPTVPKSRPRVPDACGSGISVVLRDSLIHAPGGGVDPAYVSVFSAGWSLRGRWSIGPPGATIVAVSGCEGCCDSGCRGCPSHRPTGLVITL